MRCLSFCIVHGHLSKYVSLKHKALINSFNLYVYLILTYFYIYLIVCFYTVIPVTLPSVCRTNQNGFFKEVSIIEEP